VSSTSCAPTDRLLQTLKVQVPGVTDAAASLQLWNVVDEFLRRTSMWKYEQEIPLDVGVSEYPLSLPADSAIVRAMGVSHNGMPVASAASLSAVSSSLGRLAPEQTFPDGDASFAPVEIDKGPTNLFTYAIYRPDWVTITAVDDNLAQYPLKLNVALSISKGCLDCDCGDWQLEEWMFDMFFQDWLDGTLARLYGMPAKPWNNTTMASYHGKRFRNAMGLRKQETPRGFVFGAPGPWRFPGGWTR